MPETAPALLIEGLRHRFGEHAAVDGIDLRIEQGEIFGLLGPNGAGKTTTIRVLNTLLPIQEGRIEILGYDVRRSTRWPCGAGSATCHSSCRSSRR